MRLRIKDDEYDVDEGKITVAEAKALKRNAGMTVLQWRDGLATGDPDALIFLMWIAKTRASEKVDWSSFDDIDLVSDVELVLDDEPEPDAEKQSGQGRADPTGTSGKSRTSGSTTTSRSSRSTSTSTRGKSTN